MMPMRHHGHAQRQRCRAESVNGVLANIDQPMMRYDSDVSEAPLHGDAMLVGSGRYCPATSNANNCKCKAKMQGRSVKDMMTMRHHCHAQGGSMHDNKYELMQLHNHKHRCWFVLDNLLRQHQYRRRRRRRRRRYHHNNHHHHHHHTRAIHHVA